jgi:hypothetical protein
MPHNWPREFRQRARGYESRFTSEPGEFPLSIKVRVTSGCFHREHSPAAYLLIDEHLASIPASERHFAVEEHESGPEILVFTAIATGRRYFGEISRRPRRCDHQGTVRGQAQRGSSGCAP